MSTFAAANYCLLMFAPVILIRSYLLSPANISLLYISVKKSFSAFMTFFPILACISLSVIDNIVPFYTDAHIYSALDMIVLIYLPKKKLGFGKQF